MSTFTRRTPRLSLPGTRPTAAHGPVVSAGLPTLDAVFVLPLRTSVLLEVDRFSDFGITLARYYAVEGVANGQAVAVYDFGDGDGEGEEFLASLPFDLTLDRSTRRSAAASGAGAHAPAAPSPLGKLDEAPESEAYPPPAPETYDDSHLKIAHRYISSSASSSGPKSAQKFCKDYDLSRPLQPSYFPPSSPSPLPLLSSVTSLSPTCTPSDLLRSLISTTASSPPNTVTRVVLLSPAPSLSPAIVTYQNYLRSNSLPAILLTVSKPWLHSPPSPALRRSHSQSLKVDSFSCLSTPPPPAFSEYVGALTVLKGARRGEADRYGLKRDARKVTVKMVNMPPEGGEGGGTQHGARTQKAAVPCSKGVEF